MAARYPGRMLVAGLNEVENNDDNMDENDDRVSPVIVSNVSLSFWGGIDPETGVVIDTTHPLHGVCVTDSILCLPSGRGSCTASQVMLELILNKKAPKALILRDCDGLICVGAVIAQSFFPDAKVLDIIQVSDFVKLLASRPRFGKVLLDGSLVVGTDANGVREKIMDLVSTVGSEKKPTLTLSFEEKSMLDAAQTPGELRAVECLIQYAHIASDNPTYINVQKAHIDGCTYIGPGGLKFVQRLLEDGAHVSIPTTLNSVSTDLRHWKRLGIIPTESQQASIALANAYLALGCSEQSFTCAPYLLENPPQQSQQIVWGESNAVVYANSVLGARTEKYADYLDICCAIVGKVPEVGVHLEENRQPRILLDASNLDFSTDDPDTFSLLFPVMGHLCGSLSDGEVPILIGLEKYSHHITSDHMKAFCAAFGTTGTSPLIHVAGVTPEALEPKILIQQCSRRQKITAEQLDDTFRILDQRVPDEKIDWVALGNPHLSLSECEALGDLIEALPTPRKKAEHVKVYACMSRFLYNQSPEIPVLKDFGIEFVQDTCWCMLLEPPMIPSDQHAKILTNSGKYAHYGPGLTGRQFRLGTMNECIQAASSGILRRRTTDSFPWLQQSRSYSQLTAQSLMATKRYGTAVFLKKNQSQRFFAAWKCLVRIRI